MIENEIVSEEWNWVEVSIKDEEKELILEFKGKISHKTIRTFIQLAGYGHAPPLVAAPLRVRTSCEHRSICTETHEKCVDCGENKAKSYFTPKE